LHGGTILLPEAEGRRQRAENQKPETRNQKPETRNQKPETRNQKAEGRNHKPEADTALSGVILSRRSAAKDLEISAN
jgi:hypothetical protein